MKRLIIPMVVVLGFACIDQANATVETYTVELNGYEVVGFVGSTPAEVAQAEHLAKNWGNSTSPDASAAIDEGRCSPPVVERRTDAG